MLKRTITFKDFNDKEITEDFYFHLKEDKIIELEAGAGRDGLKAKLELLQQTDDGEKAYALIKSVVKMAYGKKSPDGRKFLQTDEIWNDFEQTNAYPKFLMGFMEDPASFAVFVNGIMPQDLRDQVAKMAAGQERTNIVEPEEPPMGPRPAASAGGDHNVFEKEAPHVPTESMKSPPEGSLSDQPAARVLTGAEIREMDSDELQRGLVEGRYKLS